MCRSVMLIACFCLFTVPSVGQTWVDLWTHEFPTLMPAKVASVSGDNLAIRSDGQAVFAARALLRTNPERHDLVFQGPGPEDLFADLRDVESPEVHAVQATGNRTFALYRDAPSRCAVAEIGVGRLLWTRSLPEEGGPCVAMHVSPDGIDVVTFNRLWTRLGLDGSEVDSVTLGPGFATQARLHRLPDGNILLSEQNQRLEDSNHLVVSVRSMSGAVLWTRSVPVGWGRPIGITVDATGHFTVSMSAWTQGVDLVYLWRGLVDGSESTFQSFIARADPGRACLADHELRVMEYGWPFMTLIRFPPGSGPVVSTLEGIVNFQESELACHGEHMYATARDESGRTSIHGVNASGSLWARALPPNDGATIALKAGPAGVYLAMHRRAPGQVDQPLLRHYSPQGVLVSDIPMPARRVDSEVLDLAGARLGDPLLIVRHGFGLHLQSIDDTQGPGWQWTLHNDHLSQFIPDGFYAVQRRRDGGVDAVGSSPWSFIRLRPDGSESLRVELGNDDWVPPAITPLSENEVLVHDGFANVYRVREDQVLSSTRAEFGAVSGLDGRIRVMTSERSPEPASVLYELDPEFEPIQGSALSFPFEYGRWILHPEGLMDFVHGRSVHRFQLSGAVVFSRTYDLAPPGWSIARYTVASPEHGIASVWSGVSPQEFNLVKTGATGDLEWIRPLGGSVNSLVMDASGVVGVAGSHEFSSYAFLLAPDGSVLFQSICPDERDCGRSIRAIGTEGGRWFIAGSVAAPGEYTRRTFVSELDLSMFRSGFEAGE